MKTKQLDRFCSKFLNPGCEAVDAFTVSWAGDYNWLFAPPYLVPRVLRHMRDGREDGTLLVPEFAFCALVAPLCQAWFLAWFCDSILENPTFGGVFSSRARQQSLLLLQECHLFVYWL